MSDFADKTLITEEDIRAVAAGAALRINAKALVTPLAADLARERHISFERIAAAGGHTRRKIAVGADHGGFEMKEALKGLLTELGCVGPVPGATHTMTVFPCSRGQSQHESQSPSPQDNAKL